LYLFLSSLSLFY
jgi:hypothetical protein